MSNLPSFDRANDACRDILKWEGKSGEQVVLIICKCCEIISFPTKYKTVSLISNIIKKNRILILLLFFGENHQRHQKIM